ncbi:serine/threonine protein kinase with WD40 repeats, partial [Actinomadura verrucosospora]
MSGETSHQEHIGPYRLLARAGGGDGVRRATGPDGRDVAIRLLPPGAAPDIERMRAVLSPYAADVLDGETGVRRPYVVSRFVPGRPLAEVVAEQGPMSGDALRRMAVGLAKALAAVHRAGLAHGELGPGTVLVVDGAPVVVDFGLTAGAHGPGDVHAWAATVTFAATGRFEVPPDALPADLRPLVAAAADPDPAARPDAERLAEAASGLVVRPERPVPAPAPAVEEA